MGRGLASQFTRGTLALVLICLVVQCEADEAEATTHVVGGIRGWAFNAQEWPNGKTFRAGDVIVFSYNPAYHNVVEVDYDGYNSCTASNYAKEYSTGKDGITLGTGTRYFICSRYDHCSLGMKIVVTAN